MRRIKICPYIKLSFPTFVFKAKILGKKPETERTIEVIKTASMFDLSTILFEAFGFTPNNYFGFFSNGQKPENSSIIVEPDFLDEFYENEIDEVETIPWFHKSKSAENTTVMDIFKSKKQMLFMFEYGGVWKIKIEKQSESEFLNPDQMATLLSKKGLNPIKK